MDILSSSSINNLINNYKYSEKSNRITPLEVRKNKFSNLSKAWGSLNTKLGSLKTLLTDFKGTTANNKFSAKTTELSNSDYFTATATSTASISSYNLRVNQLAKNDIVMSDTVNSSDLAGISAGTYSIQVASGDFSQNIDVVLDGTENLEEMVKVVSEAINNAAEGVISSSVFSPSSGKSKLSLVASTTGSSNSISVSDVSGSILD